MTTVSTEIKCGWTVSGKRGTDTENRDVTNESGVSIVKSNGDKTVTLNGNIGDKFVNVEIVYTVTTTSTDIASLVVTATNEA